MFYASCAVCCVLLLVPISPAEGAGSPNGPSCSQNGCEGDRTTGSTDAVPVNYINLPNVDDAEGGCSLNSMQTDCDRSPCTIDRDGKFYKTSQTRSVQYEIRVGGQIQGSPDKLDYGQGNATVVLEEGQEIACAEDATNLEVVFTSVDSQGTAISKSWIWSCSACTFVANPN